MNLETPKILSPEKAEEIEKNIRREVIEGRLPEYVENDPTNITPDEMREKGIEKRQAKMDREKVKTFTRKYSSQERQELAQKMKEIPKGQRKQELDIFYAKQKEIMKEFEKNPKERDVEKIMKEKQVLFTHGIPLDIFINYPSRKEKIMMNTANNNLVIDTKNTDAATMIKIVLGFKPTISTSVSKTSESSPYAHYYKFGLLIDKGKIMLASDKDAFTKASGFYQRSPKYGDLDASNMMTSTIQKDISGNLRNAIINSRGAHQGARNEIAIENPGVAGLYIDNNKGLMSRTELDQIAKIARELNLPIYRLLKGEIYHLTKNEPVEASINDIQKNSRIISLQEQLSIAKDVVSKNVFKDKKIPKEAKDYIKSLEKKVKTTH